MKIIDILNAQIHRYTVIYHRHAGINVAKKKGNGGGEEGGDEGDGTHNPDIENPPLLPFLPDFE